MHLNLNELSLKDLKDLQSQVAKAISTFEDRKKKEALADLEYRARSLVLYKSKLNSNTVNHNRPPSTAK